MSVTASSSCSSSLPADLPGSGEAPEEDTRALDQPEEDGNDDSDDDEAIAPAGAKKLKGWAHGVREDEILKKHIEPYRLARQMGMRDADNYLQMVVNEFCYRISYNLPDGEEPPLPLREWTPTTPPDDDSLLSKQERKQKAAWIVWMMPRIKRWLDYHAQAGTHTTPATGKKLDPTDPINIMLFQIADTLPPNRARQGWQQFWHEEGRTTVEEEVVRRWPGSAERKAAVAKAQEKAESRKGKGKAKAKAVDPKPTGAFRQSLARALYAEMSKTEQQPYLDRAAAEKARDSAAFEAARKAWPPKDPVARQAAIDNLAPTIGRFMKGVAELTNMHVLMTLGSPSPRYHGILHTAHYSAGENNAPSPVAFPDWDAEHFNKHTLEKMKSYLRTAYSREECMASALPKNMSTAADVNNTRLDDTGLIRRSPMPETGEQRKKKQKSVASSGESSERDDDDDENESGDESDDEGETGRKRKRGASGKTQKGKRARKESQAGDDEAQGGKTGKRKASGETENGQKKRGKASTASAATPGGRIGIISGLPLAAAISGNAGPANAVVPGAAAGAEAVAKGLDEPGGATQPTADKSLDGERPHPPEDDDQPPHPPEDVNKEKEGEKDQEEHVEGDGQDEELADGSQSGMTCPPDASSWVQEIWPEIAGEYVTRSYNELLQAFVAFERAHGWSDGEKALSASGRPKQVKDWIRADCKATARLTKLHKRYNVEFWIWWKVLQPQWRKAETTWPAMDAVQKEEEGASWATLRVPGKNGLVSVVASLYWWGREGLLKESMAPEWSGAVKDVTWTLRHMALYSADAASSS
ncbi:hypothetical protein C8F01DRAFT_1257188 [Mycena amicta]|nr:hypothetical protein C8F01DRAFT_1257188 [Mycena amicta]